TLLFTGPKGTGKTSASRIIGAILNDPRNEKAVQAAYFKQGKLAPLLEPNPKEPSVARILTGTSFVVAELDAASNRGIDDVRQLRERVQLPPQGAIMSVYILDEVHMLTTEAFNALLKLLEEPPEHAVFILATTELHKIPETIVSRCRVVSFSKASETELVQALEHIAKAEKMTYEANALLTIAQTADGSFRDAVKLLETCKDEKNITLELVLDRLRLLPTHVVSDLVTLLLAKDPAPISAFFIELRSTGVSSKQLHTALVAYLHNQLLISLGVRPGTAVTSTQGAHFLLTQLSDIQLSQPSPIPLLPLELKIIELVLRAKKSTPAPQVPPQSPKKQADGALLCQQWSELVTLVAEKNQTVAALLQSAQPVTGALGTATIRVFYSFHKEQLSDPKFHTITQDCVTQLIGGPLEITYVVSDPSDTDSYATAGESLGKLAVDALM
nr:AAA family ATPase [Candidatus Woesebacteria bacterium]